MTDDEARKIAREAAREAVHETLLTIGINADDPERMQRNFPFLDSWRGSTEAVKRQGLLTAVSIIAAGILGLIWLAIKGH